MRKRERKKRVERVDDPRIHRHVIYRALFAYSLWYSFDLEPLSAMGWTCAGLRAILCRKSGFNRVSIRYSV